MDNDKLPGAEAKRLDDQLAEFTDQILAGGDETQMDEVLDQAELMELQKTVLRLKTAAQAARPSRAVTARVRAQLLLEWKKGRQPEHPLSKFFTWSWPRLALAGGLAVLSVIAIFTLFFSTPLGAPLMGTAEGPSVWAIVIILAGIVVIGLLFWLDRHD
jgi:hypothetical protein